MLLVPAAVAAQAATPSSGSISPTTLSTTWTAGPFATPNVTGQAGSPVCTANTCDDFALHVATPADYGSSHQLSISVSWPNSAADFDVYVLDKAGTVVGTAASSADPEQVLLPPDSGDYVVRVVPFNPLGQSITGEAALTTVPTNPPPADIPASSFGNYAAPDSLSNAHNAGEPSIGVNYKTGAVLYQAYTSTYKVDFSGSGAATWADHSATAANGCPQGSITSLDPILFTDHATGRTFESQLSGQDSLTCFTDDDGATWFPSQGGGIVSGVDHQTIGGGPWAPGGVHSLNSYPNAVYYCSQDIATAFCATSHDGGLTFPTEAPVYDLTQCGGLHGHVKVDPASGTAYVPNKGCGAGQAVAVSTDNGTSWTVRSVPGSTPGDSDPSVGIGRNGSVYFGYQGADGHARVAVSHDHGATWVDGQDVGAQLGIQNIVFPAMVAGDDDRAAFAFLGTTTSGNYQDQANFHGVWHLYVSTTTDGGAHWKTADATPDDPVQKGSICTGGTTCGNDRNLLDFIDVTVDKEGRVLVGYADGCTADCATGGPQNFDALATIARQTGGPRLFAAYDPKPDLTVAPPKATRSGSKVALTAVVTNQGTASADGIRVAFYSGGTLLGVSDPFSLGPGTNGTGEVLTKQLRRGTQTVTAVVDPANTIAESNEANNKSQANLTT